MTIRRNEIISLEFMLKNICGLTATCFKINNDLSIDLCLPPNTLREMYNIHSSTIHQVLTLDALKHTYVNLIACRSVELEYYRLNNLIPKNLDCESIYIYHGGECKRTDVTIPHLLNLDCYLAISNNNVDDFSGIQKDFRGSLDIASTKIQSLKTLPPNVNTLTISYNYLKDIKVFQNVDMFQEMYRISMSYITNDYNRYMLFDKKNTDYYGIINFLNCYSLEELNCVDLKSTEILKKYLVLNNKRDYLMDCALELIQNGFPNGAEL